MKTLQTFDSFVLNVKSSTLAKLKRFESIVLSPFKSYTCSPIAEIDTVRPKKVEMKQLVIFKGAKEAKKHVQHDFAPSF